MVQYMPIALLLRAEGAPWILPEDHLPPLPKHIDRRGLFLLKPDTVHLVHEKVKVKRVGFSVYDASVRVVWSAQGDQFDATIADMARPHDMDAFLFWLASYVMLSRATSYEGLLFTRLCTRQELERGAPKYLTEEIDRLIELERRSKAALRAYLAKATSPLPREILALFGDCGTL